MSREISTHSLFSVVLVCLSAALAAGAEDDRFVTVDRFVPHTSTVPANAGQRVGIFVREKLSADLASRIADGARPDGRVVLFIHGASVPSVPDYDLPYEDYSWMEYLASAGYDTFAMDLTGYGLSPRPKMDDPCNMNARDRALVTPNPLSRDCEPRYRFGLSTSQTEWDEIDRVVDYLRTFRAVERVSLIGWSAGGPRAAGYSARHPEKVDKLVLFAPAYRADSPSEPLQDVPAPGVPMRLQTRDALMNDRWEAAVACDDQVDPGIRDVVWDTIMAFDQLGSVWGPSHGVMRVRGGAGSWGFNSQYAARIEAPTMILVGEQDGLLPSADALFPDLAGTDEKVLIKMACATHFAVWESTQYQFLHEASLEWLESTTYRGQPEGEFRVNRRESPTSRR